MDGWFLDQLFRMALMPDSRVEWLVLHQPLTRSAAQMIHSIPQRKTTDNARSASSVPAIVLEVLTLSGHRLDSATRSLFKPRFGQDFSIVPVHADVQAAESERAMLREWETE